MQHNILAAIMLFFSTIASAQVTTCPPLASVSVGSVYTYTSFDDRDRVTQTQKLQVASNRIESGYQTVSMDEQIFDGQGRLTSRGEFVVRCQNEVLFLDMTRLIPDEALRGAETMEIRSDQHLLRVPINAKVGDVLPQASTHIEIGPEASGSLMTLEFSLTDRVVSSIEMKETPAGTYNALKVTQRSTARSKMLVLRKTHEHELTVWYDIEHGLPLHMERSDLKGRRRAYTVLSKME